MANYPETSNEYYGRLNAQFDEREKQLLNMGYTRTTIPGLNIAVYTLTRYCKTHCIPAAAMIHAEQRAWEETYLAEARNRF